MRMSTEEDGGATANATTSSYGGGGAGGKFRKKPFRRQATPYDRPPTALRANNTNSNDSSSWLTKLVVQPASKLISFGADRFFASVFRRRLPPPPSPQPPGLAESNSQESDGDQGTDLNIQRGEQEPGSGHCSQPINSSSSNAVTELEHLLKQKIFTRSEIAHLAELLQSRAAEVSPGDASQINVASALNSGRQKELANGISEGNRNDGIRSSVTLTPIHNSKVLENDIASPAELAKAYMGSRPSQVSPSLLGVRHQLGKEGTGLLADTPIPSKSPIMSLARRSSVSLSAAENCFITPRSLGRSAIYTMARTPYSRVHPTSKLKGSGVNSSGFAGPSTSLSSHSPLEYDGHFDSRIGTLKRGSSALDDEIGSIGPMRRRIRQKPNLLASRFHHTTHGVGVGSHEQKPFEEERTKVLKNSGENENESVPSTSYGYVPSKSKEVAAKILQQLEKISPKEKLPASKLATMQENSPSKLISSRLLGRASRSMEDVGSSKLLLNVLDDLKTGKQTNDTLPDVHESSPRKQGKAEGNDPNVSSIPCGGWNSFLNNDSVVSLEASTPGLGAGDSVAKNGASQPQRKRTFRMSAEEDRSELADGECNGLPSRSLSENKGPFEYSHIKPAGESKTSMAVTFGKVTSVIANPAAEGTRAASQSQIFASSFPAFDKPKESNSSQLFGFSSKAADNSPSLPFESTEKAEFEPERSSSLANISTSVFSEVRSPESETGYHTKPVKAVDTNGKCDDVSSAALNGSLVSRSSPVSYTAASFSDMHRTSTGSAPLFTSSTRTTNFLPTGSSTSTPIPSSGNILGGTTKSSNLGGPVFKFGSSVDPPTTMSGTPTASLSERADQRDKIDINPNSGSLSSAYSTVAAAAASSGSSFSNSTGNSLQSSIFGSATKSLLFGAGTVSQGTSAESVPSASAPAFNMNTGSSFGSLPTPSISFGFGSSLTSTSDTISLVPAGGPTSSLFKFGATSAAVSEGSAVSCSTSATPNAFSFGSSSFSSTTAVSSSSGPTMPKFSFGDTSVSSSAINTTSSFGSGTSGIFSFGGNSSASSSTTNPASSISAPSNVFGSGWQSQKSPLFGSAFTSASPSSGLSFSASANAAPPMAFNSSAGASSGPIFSFTTASASPSVPNTRSVFGNSPIGGGFAASPGNSDLMNAEDSMAEDPVPSSAPTPVFGQPSASPSNPTFAFGSAAPSQNSSFMFNGQQNQAPLQSPSLFQASGSLEFNAGGSFSLGSTGGDKSGRKIVKISRSKNRKK